MVLLNLLFTLIASAALPTYQSVGALDMQIQISPSFSRWFVKINNLKIESDQPLGEIQVYHKGLLYHSKDKNAFAIYAEGYTRAEFKELLSRKSYVSLFVSHAYAFDCEQKSNPLADVSSALKLSNVSEVFKSCDFDIAKIVTEEVKGLYSAGKAVFDGGIWGQISEAVAAVKELIPQMHDMLIEPLANLFEVARPMFNGLVCDFMKDKTRSLVFAGLTGGSGLPAMLARTGLEIAELAKKVAVIGKNRKILELIKDLNKAGKLDDKTIAQLMKLKEDIPSSVKRSSLDFKSESLQGHFEKHGKDFGFSTPDQYADAAKKFLKSVDKENVAMEISNGDIMKWNTRTNDFAAIDKQGNIKTYYKLHCNVEPEKLLKVIYDGRLLEGPCKSY